MPLFNPSSGGAAWVATTGNAAFPAVQVPSGNANTLDDYEEGTWTPADVSAAALSITVTSAQYVKNGQLVVAGCDIVYPVTANGAAAALGGLPFTSTAANAFGGIVNFTQYTVPFTANVQPSATYVLFYTFGAVAISNANLSNATHRFTFVYRASA